MVKERRHPMYARFYPQMRDGIGWKESNEMGRRNFLKGLVAGAGLVSIGAYAVVSSNKNEKTQTDLIESHERIQDHLVRNGDCTNQPLFITHI